LARSYCHQAVQEKYWLLSYEGEEREDLEKQRGLDIINVDNRFFWLNLIVDRIDKACLQGDLDHL